MSDGVHNRYGSITRLASIPHPVRGDGDTPARGSRAYTIGAKPRNRRSEPNTPETAKQQEKVGYDISLLGPVK